MLPEILLPPTRTSALWCRLHRKYLCPLAAVTAESVLQTATYVALTLVQCTEATAYVNRSQQINLNLNLKL
jgi:hypothetical protein